MLTILLVGLDDSLLKTRGLVLRQLATNVIKAAPDKALGLLEAQRFDLVVLCHTITVQQSKAIISVAHAAIPKIPVVQVLGTPFAETYDGVDADATVDRGPHQLVQAAERTMKLFRSSQTDVTVA